MRSNRNKPIREKIKSVNIYMSDLSATIGVAESTLYRWLRHPLDTEHEKKIYDALEKIQIKEV